MEEENLHSDCFNELVGKDAGKVFGNTLHGHIIRGLDNALRGSPEKLLFRQIFPDTPPSSQFAVYNKITSPKKMVIYPDFGHELIPGWNDQVFQFLRGL